MSAWRLAVPLVILNALLQAVLTWPGIPPDFSLRFIGLAVASLAVFLSFLTAVTAIALESARASQVTRADVMNRLRAHWPVFVAWTLLVLVAVGVGLLLFVLPGAIVAILTPYVTVAAMDGRRDALVANAEAIAARPWGWLWRAALMSTAVAVAWLVAAFAGFLANGPAGSLVVWLVFGVLAVWFQRVWARLYRSSVSTAPVEVDEVAA